jgi:hypothetical protein
MKTATFNTKEALDDLAGTIGKVGLGEDNLVLDNSDETLDGLLGKLCNGFTQRSENEEDYDNVALEDADEVIAYFEGLEDSSEDEKDEIETQQQPEQNHQATIPEHMEDWDSGL